MSQTVIPERVDAVVCGGGPGGSTFATCLARAGRSVVLFEREKFPRFHIGESLLPWNVPLLERIGALGKVRAAGMQVKYGARFYHQGTDLTRPVEFANGIDRDHPSAFQVKRAEFDKLLLDHARDSGANVFEEAKVEDVLFDEATGRARGVRVRLKGEETPREIAASVVIDATGRDALMSKKLGGRRRDPELDRSAAFAHYDTFKREPGPKGGDIVVLTTPDGWWWFIPFSDGSVSVGIVMPSQRYKTRTGSVEELYNESIEKTPEVKALLDGARRTTEVHALGDYSYKTSVFSGDGFCLVGDAACFLDPVFSTGVLLAMTSAEMAANVVDKSLTAKGRVDHADFAEYERVFRRAVARFARFVHGFYRPSMLETFYTPSPNKMIERGVTTVLGGGVFFPTWKARFWISMFHACSVLVGVVQSFRGKGAFERATGIVVPASE
ncbi:MAG TPA: NAD(P)/FAD-dependent oxidoreductase [Thermoanaerobaculia bacterium]|jgi:flavin-dependent dehydrogenase|nr:NAD(P)/FAD-dependent oxidoreductase [Thermoanaerobaculia bacterium]